MGNPWRLCDATPPEEYVRVEIKSKDGNRFIGYRYQRKYYTTIGNYLINDPYKWRYIPVGSFLWNEIRKAIKSLSYGEDVAYACKLNEGNNI